MRRNALVLGGGISGIAAAHRLRRHGWRVELLEASERLGGSLCTHEVGALRFELGAHTVAGSEDLDAFATEAGVLHDLTAPPTASRRRYAVRHGRLVALPRQPLGWLVSPLLSPGSGWKLLRGRLRGWPPEPVPGEGLEPLLTRRLGRRGGELLAALSATGIYAGEAQEIVAREVPWPRDRRQILRPFEGWQRWVDKAAEGIPIRRGTRVTAVRPQTRGFRVEATTGDDSIHLATDRVVAALPAAASAEVLSSLGPTDAFLAIPHAAVAVIALACDPAQVRHPLDGFGCLDPFDETQGVLGCIFSSTLAPPSGNPETTILTAVMGGRRHPELVTAADEDLTRKAWSELRPLLGLHGEPALVTVQRWIPGIPQPTQALSAARAQADELEARHPGLGLLGDWLRGVGVPACIAAAHRLLASSDSR